MSERIVERGELYQQIEELRRINRILAKWLPIDGSTYTIGGVSPEMLHDCMTPEDWVAAAESQHYE